MAARQRRSHELLGRAAELRAGGSSWEKVGQEVDRSADTVRKWPSLYAARWRRALKQAEKQLIAEATAEAVHTLRRQLRSSDEKASREAAQKLIQLRIAIDRRRPSSRRKTGGKSIAAAATDGRRIANHLGRLTDAQIDQLLAELAAVTGENRTPHTRGDD